jgi:hypothetical protein
MMNMYQSILSIHEKRVTFVTFAREKSALLRSASERSAPDNGRGEIEMETVNNKPQYYHGFKLQSAIVISDAI